MADEILWALLYVRKIAVNIATCPILGKISAALSRIESLFHLVRDRKHMGIGKSPAHDLEAHR